jgi:hypothetical protein
MCFDLGNGLLLLLVVGGVVVALGDLPFSSWNNSWLLALLLLGWLLAACPSPPGRTTGCLPFSSWDGS